MRWRVSNRFDPQGAALADRHYSRGTVGSPQFVGSGSDVVLIAPLEGSPQALWVTKWQKYVRTPWWVDAWICSLFRNEGAGLSSELITEATAATCAVWGDPPPRGFVTFVNADKTRTKRDPGRCFRKAGWKEVGRTNGGLIVLMLAPSDFPAPVAPAGYQNSFVPQVRDWRNVMSDRAESIDSDASGYHPDQGGASPTSALPSLFDDVEAA
jgi:hypothetical protein